MGDAEDQQKRLFELSRGLSSTTEGRVVSQDWDNRLVTVNIGGTTQVMSWATDAPWPGDLVRVVNAGQRPFCVPVWGAPNGVVVAVASNVATVTGDDGVTYRYPCPAGTTAGWRVSLDHRARQVGARYLVEPADSEFVVPPAPPSGGTQTRVFYPTETGNYRSGSWNGGPLSISDNRAAYMFYGTTIADTIPDGAGVASCTLTLVETGDYVPGTSSKLGYHGFASHPGSAPGLTGALNVLDGGVIDIGAYAGALISGAALGLGFPSGSGNGYRDFAGAPSAYITITYTT